MTIRLDAPPKDAAGAKHPVERRKVAARRASVLPWFKGRRGKAKLRQTLLAQPLVGGDPGLASSIARCSDLVEYRKGEKLTEQGTFGNDLYLLIMGKVVIRINGRDVATRHAGTHVGELALVDVSAKRSATVVAVEPTVVCRVREHRFTKLTEDHPTLWRRVAVEISKRLTERNSLLRLPNDQPVVFIGSSAEGRQVADRIYTRLSAKPVVPRIWSDGVFQPSSTSIESLVAQTSQADFAVIVLTADDLTVSRKRASPSPRDNVVFEVGLFIGALGRNRTFIVKPRGIDIRMPSDLWGVTCLEYTPAKSPRKRCSVTSAFATLYAQIAKVRPR